MDQDETPILCRHPLQHRMIVPPETLVLAKDKGTCESGDVMSSDSDTNLEVMSVTEEYGEKEREEDIEEEDLPMTQQVDPKPLAGLIVFVEVRSGTDNCENRRDAIAHQLEILGATVSIRLTKDVTHVVFKDGKLTTKEKAEKKGMYLVSPLWLEACKRANDRISEAKYPVLCKEGSDSPVVLGRIKRLKSMQPKPLMEEISKSLERSRKRQRTERRTSSAKKPQIETPLQAHTISETSDKDPESKGDMDNDSFELPEIKLPGTPRQMFDEVVTSVTPESVVQSKPQKSTGGRAGKGSSKKKALTKCTNDKDDVCVSDGADQGSVGGHLKKGLEVKGGKKKEDKTTQSIGSGRKTKKRISTSKDNIENEVVGQTSTATKTKKLKLDTPLQPSSDNNKSLEEASKEEQKDQTLKQKKKRNRFQKSSFEKQKPTMVLTSVQTCDQETVHSIVEKLERFECSKTVSDSTTHVICGNPRRTINILSATLQGCWILRLEWVMKSLECGYWVPEDPYEMSREFPSARFFRLDRQQSVSSHQPSLFKGCGSVFIANGSLPPATQLERLLTLGGGKVTTSHRKADVCVGCRSWSNDVKSVSEQWVLDSITEHKLLPVEDYLLDSASTREASPEL